MKLRIKGSTLRIRLSKTEVEKIAKGFLVEEVVHFGDEVTLKYAFSSDKNNHLKASFEKQTIHIFSPEDQVKIWAEDENKVGFEHTINHKDGTSLHILVEKDFQCLTERGEDESDLFQNPDASESC